ncbi:hypothetical protein RND71_009882 [Anisodus tanguticus]|uniref:CCT domain-containing protein n=1 Tax=Anisodus tanguticus TaxID=243964 RepID=A0AAE1SIL8_9SOLA|nr:hypothetical protein RND71_009882 [Anisodus tanguticus]
MENTTNNYVFNNHFPITSSQTPLVIPSVNIEFDSLSPLKSEFGYNSSSSWSSYGSPASSVTSYGTHDPTLIQRSISSHSLVKNMEGFCPLVSSPTSFIDSETSPVRKVLSTGDLQYECRKTLADSRPRIRGRFARNDEIERNPQNENWNQSRLEEGEEDDENWIGFLDAFIP